MLDMKKSNKKKLKLKNTKNGKKRILKITQTFYINKEKNWLKKQIPEKNKNKN